MTICMLATPFTPSLFSKHKDWAIETKYDGVRILAEQNLNGTFSIYSRGGKRLQSIDIAFREKLKFFLQAYATRFGMTDRILVDAEFIVGDFISTVSAARKHATVLEGTLYIFDVYNGFPLQYYKRKEQIKRILMDNPSLTSSHITLQPTEYTFAQTPEQIDQAYKDHLDKGLEGLMLKVFDSPYEFRRSKYWLKLKEENTLDLTVFNAFEGEGKYVGMLGGLLAVHKDIMVSIGTGFTDAQRRDLWEDYIGDIKKRAMNQSSEFKLLNRIIEVSYQKLTERGSLRHARFKRFRDTITGSFE